MSIIPVDFYRQPTLTVARALLGQHLVRDIDGERLAARIVETEAYIGPDDSACHGKGGRRTARNAVMFGPAGQAYVYLIYGMYHMLNIVTEADGFPAAVLLRAVEPVAGLDRMQVHRPGLKQVRQLTNGPGKLSRAFDIDMTLNNWNLTVGEALWLESTAPVPDHSVATGPRININSALPKDRDAPWRFWEQHNRFVSK